MTEISAAEELVRDWSFTPSPVAARVRLSRRLRSLTLRRPAPASCVIAAATPAHRWSVYFAYLPDGEVTPAHLYSLDRLAAEPGKLLVVCSTPDRDQLPAAIRDGADALIWKALPGYDFSAYGLALRHLVATSPGADVFVMNDSVFGPFASPALGLGGAPWDLAGYTASSLFENHVQSYAFQVRRLTAEKLVAMAPVLPSRTSFHRYMDVVICQETRLARHAAGAMSVGARWFAPHEVVRNLSLERGAMLAGAGVPFIKKSLLGRYGNLQDAAQIAAILETHRHPLPEAAG